MKPGVIVRLVIAIVAGLLAAYGTYRITSEKPLAHQSHSEPDTGPLF
jgi:hypothetical protein